MCEKAIWLDIVLVCCIFTRLRLVKIRPHTCAISSHISYLLTHQIIYLYQRNSAIQLTSVGLAHACPNYICVCVYVYIICVCI